MSDRKTLDERAQMTDLERVRHSAAHVMATAILRIWPDAQFAYGPPVENGFYYDFEMEHRITPDDFEKIEAEMKKIAKENQKFEYKAISRDEAKAMAESGRLGGLTERPGNASRFKLDLIDKIPEGEQISCFQNGDFIDLCAGSHVGYTSKCKNVKIMSVSSSFYMGDETKGQLQRLYGTAFENKEDLATHLERLEEAKKRDHRKLGRELGLFHIDEAVGQGLILWKPKGALVRRALQEFITQELDKQGYSQVFTPHIGKLDLYRTSGHFPYYQDSQYAPIPERDTLEKLADEDATCATLVNGLNEGTYEGYMLKPMNCPHHIKIFRERSSLLPRSSRPPRRVRHRLSLGTIRRTRRHDPRPRFHPGRRPPFLHSRPSRGRIDRLPLTCENRAQHTRHVQLSRPRRSP